MRDMEVFFLWCRTNELTFEENILGIVRSLVRFQLKPQDDFARVDMARGRRDAARRCMRDDS